LLAGAFFVSLPLIYAISIDPEIYFMTLLPLLLVCCSHLFEEKCNQAFWWLAVGCITALGVLCKWLFAIYLLGPIVFLAWQFLIHLRKQENVKGIIKYFGYLILMIFPVLLVAVFWYWPNREILLSEFNVIVESKQFTQFKQGWTWQVSLFYIQDFFVQNKLFPSLFVLVGILFSILPNRVLTMLGCNTPTQNQRYGLNLMLSSVIGFWLYFTIRYENIPLKYIYGLLPVLSVFAVNWLELLRWRKLRVGLSCIILLYAAFCSIWMHFAPTGWLGDSNLPRAVGIQPDQYLLHYGVPVPRPPHLQSWPHQAIAKRIAEEESESRKHTFFTILPDLYYFDWRNNKVALRIHVPHVSALPLDARKGLERLVYSDYILSCRGRVSRYPYPLRKQFPVEQTHLSFARLIDRAPQWFWNHFRQIDTFEMPYAIGDLDLYKKIKPFDDASTVELANFWMTHHLDEPQAWEQIRNIWSARNNKEWARRSEKYRAYLDEPAGSVNNLVQNVSLDELMGYEALQLGSIGLNTKQNQLGTQLLLNKTNSNRFCQWKGNLVLSKQLDERSKTVSKEELLLSAWRVLRERPEPLFEVSRFYHEQGETARAQLFQEIANLTVGILDQNRKPNLYRAISAKLLPYEEFRRDALWFAQQAFLTGFNRFPNTIHLFKAQKALGRLQPDYEQVALEQIDPEYGSVELQPGESFVFAFLNMEEGRHALRWEHSQTEEITELEFKLDGKMIGSKQLTRHQNGEEVEFLFDSPAWADRLRITNRHGNIRMTHPRLVKLSMNVPLFSSDNEPNVHTHQMAVSKANDGKGIRLQMIQDNGWFYFPHHTDPRAWEQIGLETDGLPVDKLRMTYILRDGIGNEPKTISEKPEIQEMNTQTQYRIRIPEEVKDYPFLLGIRFHVDNAIKKDVFVIKSIRFNRNDD